jgi:hypothetical protein
MHYRVSFHSGGKCLWAINCRGVDRANEIAANHMLDDTGYWLRINGAYHSVSVAIEKVGS